MFQIPDISKFQLIISCIEIIKAFDIHGDVFNYKENPQNNLESLIRLINSVRFFDRSWRILR